MLAAPGQLAGAALAAAALIVIAFAQRRRPVTYRGASAVPRPWLLGLVAFGVASAHFLRPESWTGVAMDIILVGLAAVLVWHWSRQRGWARRHQFALVGGAMLTYAWGGFALTGLLDPGDTVRWSGNAFFALVALILLFVTARRVW